jgi:hypothetical protein
MFLGGMWYGVLNFREGKVGVWENVVLLSYYCALDVQSVQEGIIKKHVMLWKSRVYFSM